MQAGSFIPCKQIWQWSCWMVWDIQTKLHTWMMIWESSSMDFWIWDKFWLNSPPEYTIHKLVKLFIWITQLQIKIILYVESLKGTKCFGCNFLQICDLPKRKLAIWSWKIYIVFFFPFYLFVLLRSFIFVKAESLHCQTMMEKNPNF